ncbi:MAG TPA: hypothetical protein VFM48_15675 [Aquabacterium sp.]|nr:hypothetical protein [Aquabacterium sp.]
MQIKQIALATLAVVAAAQAHAVTRVSGASASSIAYVEALATNNSCPSNNVSIYKRGTSTVSLGNQFTVKCNSGNFAGTTENEVQFDVTGGSLNAILFSADGAGEALAANGNFLPSTTAGCTATTVSAGPLTFASGKLMNCAANASLVSGKSIGGFMDVEPAVFQAQGTISGDYSASVLPATFSQVFGVAASKALYEALQTAQGLTVGSTTPANQPTISRAQIVSLMNANDYNEAKNKGPKFLVPSTTETNITYCRRPVTSGTQAAAEVYFLQNPTATGALGGAGSAHEPAVVSAVAANNTVVVNNGTGNTLTVKVNSGSGDVKGCLNAAGFAFGMLSAENNPIGGSDTFRFVKLNGQEFSEGVAGASQTAAAIAGKYDYVFESALFNPTGSAVLDLINSKVVTGSGTPGVFLNVNSATPESQFTRSGNSLNVYSSN